MKTKCARPYKSFKVTPFKYQNVSGRTDVKMLMVAGAERVIAQTLQILRPFPGGAHCRTAPTSCWDCAPRAREPGVVSPGQPLATDGQENGLDSLVSWARLGGWGNAQSSCGTESELPLCYVAGCLSLLVP